MGAWRFSVTDLAGVPLDVGSPGLASKMTGKTVALLPPPTPSTFTFAVPLSHPAADAILDEAALIKAYRLGRDGTARLVTVFDIADATESSELQGGRSVGTVNATCTDALWRLQGKLLGVALGANGMPLGTTFGSAAAQVDLATIVYAMLLAANTRGYSGIEPGTIGTTGTLGYSGPHYFRPSLEAIAEVSALAGGPDLVLRAVEPVSVAGGVQIAALDVVASAGSDRSDTVTFDFNCNRRNCSAYSRRVLRTNMTNLAWATPPGFPDSPALIAPNTYDPVLSSADLASIAKWGLFERIASSDVTTGLLRAIAASEYVAICKDPQQQVEFTPLPDTRLDPLVDYGLGDVVGVHARSETGAMRLDGTARIYGMTFTLPDSGGESCQVSVLPST